MSQPEIQSDFKIVSAVFSSNRKGNDYNVVITNSIAEIEIYEHIDKPFLTALFAIDNSEALLEVVDFQGTESIEISIQSSQTEPEGTTITKKFIATSIEKTVRITERSELVYLRAYEDIAFKSSLINVNKPYEGNVVSIVSKIITEYLDKGVAVSSFDDKTETKVIIPNLSPINAAIWVKNQAYTKDGLPFYLYSTLSADNIFLSDLGSIINQEPMNTNMPFLYWQSAANVINPRHSPILDFSHENVENTLALLRKGVINSRYTYIDTLKNTSETSKFNATNDLFKNLYEEGFINRDDSPIHEEAYYDDKAIDEYTPSVQTIISSNGAFTGSNYSLNSLYEEENISNHRKNLSSNSIKNFMTKSPISIVVHGKSFIRGDGHYSIGNKARVVFLDTDESKSNEPPGIDTKKSGDYIIYAAKHVFEVSQANKVTSSLLCAKISSFSNDIDIRSFI